MKKLPVLLLASLMLLSCAACGRAGGDGDTSAFVTTDEENVQTEAIPENEETGEAETQASDESASAFTVFNGETHVPIPLAFVASYSAKSGTYADGIRMFSSLGYFIRNKDLPEITYCNGYDIKYAALPGEDAEKKPRSTNKANSYRLRKICPLQFGFVDDTIKR